MDKAGTSGGIRGKMLLFAAFLIVCFNLRTGFDSPDPLLGTIERDMGLSLENSGLFALLPVFVLGVAAPISPRVARRMTPWKIIFWFQLLAVAGIFWRSWDGVAGLYGGMVLMGLGMGIAGAAIPGLIKHQFPDRASAMMGVYSAMIGVGSAVGIIMGNVIGDGDLAKVDDYARKSHRFAVFLGVLIALLTVGSAFVAPSFFVNNSIEARNQAQNLLLLYACTAVFRTVTFNLVIGVLRSGGDTTYCMVMETLAIWLISVPLVLVGGLVFEWNVYILYLLSMVSEVVKCVFFYLRMRSGKWIKFDMQPQPMAVEQLEEELQ